MPSTFRELEAILTLDGKLKDCQNKLKKLSGRTRRQPK